MFQSAHKHRKCAIFLIPLLVFFFWNFDFRYNDKPTFPIVFYHQAYVDFRFSPPQLRVFSLNPCLRNASFLLAQLPRLTLKLSAEPVESDCPWSWAPSCYYNSHVFHASLGTYTDVEKIDKILLHFDHGIVSLPVKFVSRKKKKGLTVCVQPVYWYSQFQNIILFIEAWRAHGADNFIIYFHSSTKEVRLVLDYYQRLGIITIRPWPKFPDLHPKFPDVNAQTYRTAHTLAINICLLEMESELGTFVDFDEVIVPPSGDLRMFVEKELSIPSVGALQFTHSLMNVKLSSDKILFDKGSIMNPVFLKKEGPPKLVFNTSAVDIVLTHGIRRFIPNSKNKTVEAKGALLHNRYDSLSRNLTIRSSQLKIFPSKVEKHIRNMEKVVAEIKRNNDLSFDPMIILELNKCIDQMRESGECRSAVIKCREQMEKLANWYFDETPDVFLD